MPRVNLEDTDLFRELDADDVERLKECAIHRRYEQGQQIFDEHEEAYGICMLLEGRIALQLDIGGGRRLTVGTVDPGELFALSGLVPPHTFTAAARAVTDCDVIIFPAETLAECFDSDPALGYAFMRQVAQLLSNRLRDSYLQLVGLFGS